VQNVNSKIAVSSHNANNRSLTCELPLIGGVTDFLRLCRIACQQSV